MLVFCRNKPVLLDVSYRREREDPEPPLNLLKYLGTVEYLGTCLRPVGLSNDKPASNPPPPHRLYPNLFIPATFIFLWFQLRDFYLSTHYCVLFSHGSWENGEEEVNS